MNNSKEHTTSNQQQKGRASIPSSSYSSSAAQNHQHTSVSSPDSATGYTQCAPPTTSDVSISKQTSAGAATGPMTTQHRISPRVAQNTGAAPTQIQTQPLQAISSNSGTSVRRSDNISQSSYPAGDISCDKASYQALAANRGGPSNSSSSGGYPSQMAHGHLTNCFAGLNKTTDSQNAPMTGTVAQSRPESSSADKDATGRRQIQRQPQAQGSSRRQTSGSSKRRGLPERPHTPSGAPQVSLSSSGLTGAGSVQARTERRVTRASDQRAVKDASLSSAVGNQTVDATDQKMIEERPETHLKPVKQSNSESGTMRTTRSKTRAEKTDQNLSERPKVPDASCNSSLISNGQSQSGVRNTQSNFVRTERQESRNLEKFTVESDELGKPEASKQENARLNRSWQGEDCKMQSPRSHSSTINVPTAEKGPNQSFQINDSTDSLQENPLSLLIKQYQNWRITAQSQGGNKPTIQQFLEKFEKEMQFLEDQYQTQQAARQEQMRLFELHYGGNNVLDDTKPRRLAGATHLQGYQSSHPNDQLLGCGAQFSQTGHQIHKTASSNFNDTLMVQDTSTLGPMPHESSQNNSFNSAVHGPNHASGSVFGASSEITTNEVYESFQFTPNALVSFYPRQVRKILSRRKTHNSANTTLNEIRDLKQPKHRSKIAKTMSKMQGLAMCQMNMMQIMLQKISRRSKVIRKQERIVNENLKRKRIYLERERFDLMSVLRKSLEAQETGAAPSSISASCTAQSNATLAQKTTKPRTINSDINSRCPSTAGTKSGLDQHLTQSVKGSVLAQPYCEEVASLDGCQSRKQTRINSGADNYLSSVPEEASNNVVTFNSRNNKATGSNNTNVIQTPETHKGKSTIANQEQVDEQIQRAEERVKQAVNLSEIDDTFLNISQKSQHVASSGARKGIVVPAEEIGSQSAQLPRLTEQTFREGTNAYASQYHSVEGLAQTPQKGHALTYQEGAMDANQIETPFFDDYDQFKQGSEMFNSQQKQNQDQNLVGTNTEVKKKISGRQPAPRKNQTTANRRGKKQSQMSSLERDGAVAPKHPPIVPINLDAKLEAVADNMAPAMLSSEPALKAADSIPSSLVQTQHNADGTIKMTIKKQDLRLEDDKNAIYGQDSQSTKQRQSNSKSKRRKPDRAATMPVHDKTQSSGDRGATGSKQLQNQQVKPQTGAVQSEAVSGIEHQIQQPIINHVASETADAQFKSQEQKQFELDQHQHHTQNTKLNNPFESHPADLTQSQNQHYQHQLLSRGDHLGKQHDPHHAHFLHHAHSLPIGDPEMPHYFDLEMMNEGGAQPGVPPSILHPDHFMLAPPQPEQDADDDHAHGRQGIFYEQIKTGGVRDGRSLSRAQTVQFPHHHHEPNMLFDMHQPHQHHDHQMMEQLASNSGNPASGYAQFQGNPQTSRAANQKPGAVGQPSANIMGDPLFDESAQELSSIEHTATAGAQIDSYAGFNPYEQAKRKYVKQENQSQSRGASAGHHLKPSDQSGANTQPSTHLNPHQYLSSPMGPSDLPSAQVTPQPKEQQPVISSTPRNFMSGVNMAANEAARGLGKEGIPGSRHDHQHMHLDHHHRQDASGQDRDLPQHPHQLSVSRLCAPDPFLDSDQGHHHNLPQHHQIHQLSDLRGGAGGPGGHHPHHGFSNTPAGLLSNGQGGYHHNHADTHRQNLSVSGWNLEEGIVVDHHHLPQHHHHQPQIDCVDASDIDVVNDRDGTNGNQIYEGLPGHYM